MTLRKVLLFAGLPVGVGRWTIGESSKKVGAYLSVMLALKTDAELSPPARSSWRLSGRFRAD